MQLKSQSSLELMELLWEADANLLFSVILFIALKKLDLLFLNSNLDWFRELEELKGILFFNSRMAKIAGRINTMHYVLTSDFIYAPKAKELGFVSEVFKKEELHDKVIGIANEITNKPLTAILAAKEAIKQTENLSMSEGIAL